jgi:type I restriction enzyme S subunit
MKLSREKWVKASIGEIASIQYGSSEKMQIEGKGFKTFRMNEIVNGLAFDNGEMKKTLLSEEDFQAYRLQKGDILFNRTNSYELVGRTGVFNLDGDYMFASYLLRLKIDPQKADSFFVTHLMTSDVFQKQLKTIATKAVGQANINPTNLKKQILPLPPLEEQKQIAGLFQSIETAMEQVDGQEKNLKALWLRLIDEFVSDKPKFGNLLKGKKLKKVNYADVTEKLMRRIEPVSYGIERIVAGENLESEDLKIRTWGVVGKDVLGPAFHVLFKPGDILYGSRRTYLKKVSFADFEGVCANTTYVIRAKENILLQDLIKHIMLSSRFTQYSIGVSKGSTNPYINWKDLDDFAFELPDLEVQREIANALDEILKIREQLKQQKATLKLLKQKLLGVILG